MSVMGKVLWIDLTGGKITEEVVPEEVYQNFLSGIGLAAYFLYREIPAGADALGPENVLGFVSGLMNATNSLFTGRWMAAAKSPLTGTWGEANCGGTLAAALKRSGYDGFFFKGASTQPVYLLLDKGKAELRNAADLWGVDAIETELCLRARHPDAAVACIGAAGEKRSLIAGIVNDGGRMAARSGLGAVMGAKGLKALVVRGTQKVLVKDGKEMQRLSKQAMHWVRFKVPLPSSKIARYLGSLIRILPFQWAQPGMLYKALLQHWGTISMNQISVEMGDAPVQNWRGSSTDFRFSRSNSTDPDRITQFEVKKYHCRSCALGCGGIISNSVVQEGHKPEYETVMSLGSLLMNEDLESIFQINERLNRAGMDSISAGATVAFAIECAERGLLSAEELDGLDLRWGNSQAVEALIERMIAREGIGDLLADGARMAAQRIDARNHSPNGHVKAADFAMHAGGQELAMHDGRNDPGFALHAVVEPMPGRHTNGSQTYYEMFELWTRLPGLPRASLLYGKNAKYEATPEQAQAAVACSRFSQVLNGAGYCLFGALMGVSRIPIFEWMNAATGWQLTPEEYMQVGARIQALKQMFNARQGADLRHTINRRTLGLPPQARGANRGRTLDMDAMVRAYWEASGWDENSGMPTTETLYNLGLEKLPLS